MEFSSRRLANVVVAAPVGRIDHPSAQALERALAPILDEAAAGTSLVLDLSGVDYISSMGLRVLMAAAKHMRGRTARVAVAAMQPVVEEIFAIARFQHVIDAYPSVTAALEHLSPSARGAASAR